MQPPICQPMACLCDIVPELVIFVYNFILLRSIFINHVLALATSAFVSRRVVDWRIPRFRGIRFYLINSSAVKIYIPSLERVSTYSQMLERPLPKA